MDLLKNALAEAGGQKKPEEPKPEPSLFDKLHGLAGGGRESEKKEDHIDKGSLRHFS